MPNRLIKESICESRKLADVSFFAEDLYKRLITYADDYGRFNADYQIILARLYPREMEIVSIDDIDDAMTELIGAGKIAFYTSEARKEIYGCFPKWADHQRVRDSKKRCPDPADTQINDWYLKRFVPKDMKRYIIMRDKMKCQECGKYIFANVQSADRVIKFGAGLFHIDHIVPVCQGGRATEENLRLLCPSCNLKRKRHFSIEEIISFSQEKDFCGESRQVAANCGLIQSNPIQSESNPNPNPNPTRARARRTAPDDGRFDTFWAAYPRHDARLDAEKAFKKLNPDDELMGKILKAIEAWKQTDQWKENGGQFIPYPATWLNKHRWEDEIPASRTRSANVGKPVSAQQYAQRDYDNKEQEAFDRMMSNLISEYGDQI